MLAVVAGSLSSTFGGTTTVGVVGLTFNPPVISVQAGDKVIWTGLGFSHSVASDTPPETLCGSTPVPLGNCTNVFNMPETYRYHCVNHGALFGMTGVVNVAAVALLPTVVITNPAAGAVFATPASVMVL